MPVSLTVHVSHTSLQNFKEYGTTQVIKDTKNIKLKAGLHDQVT
jgi:hypothetical protein